MPSWKGQSIGSLLGHKIFVWSLKFLGLRFCYFLLRPVTYFYYRTAKMPTWALRCFYQQLFHDEKQHNKLIRKNFYVFGQTLVDKVAMGKGLSHKYELRSNGREYIRSCFQSGKGCLLISAHLGNWEIAGNILNEDNMTVHVVLFDHEQEQLKKYLANQKKQKSFHIIAVQKDFSHLIAIKNALAKGDVVCIHGDRYTDGGRTIQGNFLGKKAFFPMGPFQLAAKLNVPYHFVFAVKEAPFCYQFSCTETKTADTPEAVLTDYIYALEHQVKLHPEQWFNFYNFYDGSSV